MRVRVFNKRFVDVCCINTKKITDILVYDDLHPDIMARILNGRDYFHMKPTAIYFSPKIFFIMLLKLGLLLRKKFSLNNIVLWNHYAFLVAVNPKLVATIIDNTRNYRELDRLLHDKFFFLTIQNGNRFFDIPRKSPDKNNPLTIQEQSANLGGVFHSYFCCFGQFETVFYEKCGATVKKFAPFGSLMNSIYLDEETSPLSSTEKHYDLCLVSSFTPGLYTWPEFADSYETMCKWYVEFVQRHPELKACVAGRDLYNGKYYKQEKEWYGKLGLGEILQHRKDRFSTNRLVDASDVSIMTISTVLFDAISRRNKVVMVDPCAYDIIALPTLMMPDPILYIYGGNYSEFEKNLYAVLNTEESKYNERISAYADYMVTAAHKGKALSSIRKKVDEVLLSKDYGYDNVSTKLSI